MKNSIKNIIFSVFVLIIGSVNNLNAVGKGSIDIDSFRPVGTTKIRQTSAPLISFASDALYFPHKVFNRNSSASQGSKSSKLGSLSHQESFDDMEFSFLVPNNNKLSPLSSAHGISPEDHDEEEPKECNLFDYLNSPTEPELSNN